MMTILILGLLALIAWFWLDSIRSKEIAMQAAAVACHEIQAQFLDQTASIKTIKPVRNHSGRLTLQRSYQFDYTRNRQNRLHGEVIIRGKQVTNVFLEENNNTTILQ